MKVKITSILLFVLIGSGNLLQANATRQSLQRELETKIMACNANAFKKQFVEVAHMVTTPDEQTAFNQALIFCAQAVKRCKTVELRHATSKKYIQNRFHAWKTLL